VQTLQRAVQTEKVSTFGNVTGFIASRLSCFPKQDTFSRSLHIFYICCELTSGERYSIA